MNYLRKQISPSATTLTDFYTVLSGVGNHTLIKTIIVCNRSATSTAFRISLAIRGAADAISQYWFYDAPILGNETLILDANFSIGYSDVVRVYASLATLTFNISGEEY